MNPPTFKASQGLLKGRSHSIINDSAHSSGDKKDKGTLAQAKTIDEL